MAAIEAGWVQGEIEAAAFRHQQEVESGERVIVGVNRYTEAGDQEVELQRIDPAAERRQLERTRAYGPSGTLRRRPGRSTAVRAAARDASVESAAADARGAARVVHDRRDLQRPSRRVRDLRQPHRALISHAKVLSSHRGPPIT